MNPNLAACLKFSAAFLCVAGLAGLEVVKHFWPSFETTMLNSILVSILTGLGVYHMSSPVAPDAVQPITQDTQ